MTIADVRPVQLADVERRARAALADRLGHAAEPTVVRDSADDTAAILTVDSGGTAVACEQALSVDAGYVCEPRPGPPADPVQLGVRPGDAVDSALFRRALRLFRSLGQPSFDPRLSEDLMPVLRELVPPERSYLTRLERFASHHRERLNRLYDDFGADSEHDRTGRYALVRQPEGLIIVEQLATARYDLFAAFDGEIEDRYLTDAAKAWGVRA